MTTRRVTTHKTRNSDGEILDVITVYEHEKCKEQIKKENRFTKNWGTLIQRQCGVEWVKPIRKWVSE